MFITEVKSKINEDISILIKLDNYSFNFICDCGDASDLTVKECQNTEAIFITHTHIDHFINFDTILRHQIGIQRRVIICGPEGITNQVQSKIKGYQWNLINEDAIIYEVREIKNNGQISVSELKPTNWEIIPLAKELEYIFSNDKFFVEYLILDHKTASIAYLFKERDTVKIDLSNSNLKGGVWVNELKNAFLNQNDHKIISINENTYIAKELYHLLEIKKGDSLGIILDHAADESNHKKIIQKFKDCKTVYIECFYKNEDKEQAILNYHSYAEQSAAVMKKCKIKNAIPVHFSRKYKTEDIQKILDEFNIVFNNKC